MIQKIFEAVRAAVKIPFTVKFRAGWSESELVFRELAKMAEGCGLNAIAMHARTREQGYSGQAQWQWIAELKSLVSIPVIGNGDIRTPEDARAMVAETGCDARDDRPRGGIESVDLPADCAIHCGRAATMLPREPTAMR